MIDYKRGLNALKICLPEEELDLFDALTARLLENLNHESLFGGTPTTRSERSEIIYYLNRLARKYCGMSFNELCESTGTSKAKIEDGKDRTSTAQSSNSMERPKSSRASAFISYSHKDRKHLDELHAHLAPYVRMGVVDFWDDTKIPPGSKWHEEITKAIQSAKVAVLLVSADFLASDFIASNELPPLLAAAEQEGAIILPVILRPCAFKDTDLAQFQTINAPSNPLSKMTRGKREEVWTKVAEVIKNTLKQPN